MRCSDRNNRPYASQPLILASQIISFRALTEPVSTYDYLTIVRRTVNFQGSTTGPSAGKSAFELGNHEDFSPSAPANAPKAAR
jgi:hypothetical protein